MYCSQCGKLIQDDANLCAYCGNRIGTAARRQLIRPRAGRKVAGVAAAFAAYFQIDVTLVRVLWLLAEVFTIPLAIVAYIVAWIVIPEEPKPITKAPTPSAGAAIDPQI